jgi:cytochrome bd-type quinol oxidase subunit 2
MLMQYDLLVYVALFAILIVVAIAAYVLVRTPDTSDLEARKVHFAAATFTGILVLFVFAAILFFADPDGPGKEIFDKAVTAMTPLVGAIIGYLFGSRHGGSADANGTRRSNDGSK